MLAEKDEQIYDLNSENQTIKSEVNDLNEKLQTTNSEIKKLKYEVIGLKSQNTGLES